MERAVADFQGALEAARDELFVDTADGSYLDTIGENFGVLRPRSGIDDATWRAVLRLVMMAPKTSAERLEALLDVLLGDTLRIEHTGDARTDATDLRVEVLLDTTWPPGVRPQPPAVAIRLSGRGVPADGTGSRTVTVTTAGVRVGTQGSPAPTPAPGPEVVVAHAPAGQAIAQLARVPIQLGTLELWVRTPEVAAPVALPPSCFAADPEGRITLGALPATVTCFVLDPATGRPLPRPGLPAGAELLASYVIDTRTYAGLAAALRHLLPPVYRVTLAEASGRHAWLNLQGTDQRMGPARRIDLRSWSIHDVGRALGPPDAQPTTPFLDRHTLGPRVFVDLLRRDDITRPRPDARQASYLHDDLLHPAPRAPQRWAVHPWNASADPDRLATDPGFVGPYVYTFDERLQPCGREHVPGDATTWEPFPTEWATVLARNPRTGQDEAVEVRQDRFAENPFTGSPLEISPGSGALYQNIARPLRYSPRPDRSDHPLALFADDFQIQRLAELVDLVRAAGAFVTFERGPELVDATPPVWYCDSCYSAELVTRRGP